MRKTCITTLLIAAACEGAPSALAPAGPDAARIASLWWVLATICGSIYVVFAVIALFAMLQRRRSEDPREQSERRSARWVLVAGGVIPAMIVTALVVVTLGALRDLSSDRKARVIIEVHGRLWWWELRYLDERGALLAVSANEMHVPVNERVELRLVSDNVIHSFWVPQLHGKLDLIPGKANVLTLRAARPSQYRGFCAEYCGLQHTHMGLLVVATPRPEFDEWLALQAEPAPVATEPQLTRGRDVFERNCGTCHTVRGTRAQGIEGPDLTHIGGRRTLASVTLPNNPDNLGTWITRAQSIKPGSLMPNVELLEADRLDIVAYLMALR